MDINERKQKFFKDAEAIEDKAINRLSPKTREVFNNNNYVFDAHCHIFDGECIDAKYFILRML